MQNLPLAEGRPQGSVKSGLSQVKNDQGLRLQSQLVLSGKAQVNSSQPNIERLQYERSPIIHKKRLPRMYAANGEDGRN